MSKPHDLEYLKDAAKAVEAMLPDHHGVIIIAVPFKGGDQRLKYTSNLSQESAVEVLTEFLNTIRDEDKWGKHSS